MWEAESCWEGSSLRNSQVLGLASPMVAQLCVSVGPSCLATVWMPAPLFVCEAGCWAYQHWVHPRPPQQAR